MKSTKLLGAVSAATLLGGVANALPVFPPSPPLVPAPGPAGPSLEIDQINTLTGTLSDSTPIGGASTISGAYLLAEEVDFPQLVANGDADAVFGLEVRTQGVIPPGQNIFLTIEIENGTLAANLDGSEILTGITGAVVDSGGSIGDDFVRYLITTDTFDLSTIIGRDGIALDLPILLSSCGDTTFNVTEFRTEGTGSSGTDIEGGTAMLTDGFSPPAVQCVDAYRANLFPDFGPTVLDFTTGFTNFVVGIDSPTVATLGSFGLFVDTTAAIDLDGTLADPNDVLGFEAMIDFDDTSGIVSGEGIASPGSLFSSTATAPSSGSIPLVGSNVASGFTQGGLFTLTVDGATAISPQEVTVSNANIFLDTSDALVAEDPFLNADVEDLRVNGQFYGFFDWVADANGFVNSIFRISGLDGLSDIPAQLIVKNAQGGGAYDGTYAFTILASDVEGSEIRLNSDALSAIVGTTAPDGLFRTADIALVISTDLDLDVDRLLSGPAQATVVPFGDGANQDGTGALAPADDPAGGVNGDDGSF